MIIEILFLSAAISVDAFTASFAYGCRRIKIPVLSVVILNAVSVLFLSASLLAGAFLSSLIPAGLTAQLSFLILFVLGLVKLFESPSDARTQDGDKNHDNLLSASEAFYHGARPFFRQSCRGYRRRHRSGAESVLYFSYSWRRSADGHFSHPFRMLSR